MINKILTTIIKALLYILRLILDIILLPLTAILDSLFPDMSTYAQTFTSLCNTYLFPGLRFVREVIFNLTGLNRNLVGILFMIPFTYFSFMLLNSGIRFLMSIYRLWKQGGTD